MILTLAIAPPAALSISQSVSDYSREIALIERDLVRVTEIVTSDHENVIGGTREVLKTLTAQEAIRLGAHPACHEVLEATTGAFPRFGALVTIDKSGHVACAAKSEREGTDVHAEAWFRALMEPRDFVVSGFVENPLTQTRTILTAAPIRGETGEVTGAIAAVLNLAWLVAMPRHNDLPKDAFLLMIDTDGEMVPLKSPAEGTSPEFQPVDLAIATQTSSISVRNVSDRANTRYVLAVTPPMNEQIRFVLGRPAEAVFGPSRLKLAGRLAIPLLILIATILAAWIAGNRMFVRWIVYLQRFASIYAGGRYSVRPQNLDAAPVELRQLGGSLSQMMEAISKRDAQLKEELSRREILIKEIHHRVKNNLQIIGSLLSVQARRLTDEAAKSAMFDVRQRIDALALVHRSIYESNDLESVELKSFFEGLASQLSDLVGRGQRNISLTMELPARRVLPDIAIALAMMVTEAVTNAYRHAFVGRRNGVIEVRLIENVDGSALLTISDDGLGVDAAKPDEGPGRGLGRTLMEGIARQLGGTISIEASQGTTVKVMIPRLS